jgi:hypothetical protein
MQTTVPPIPVKQPWPSAPPATRRTRSRECPRPASLELGSSPSAQELQRDSRAPSKPACAAHVPDTVQLAQPIPPRQAAPTPALLPAAAPHPAILGPADSPFGSSRNSAQVRGFPPRIPSSNVFELKCALGAELRVRAPRVGAEVEGCLGFEVEGAWHCLQAKARSHGGEGSQRTLRPAVWVEPARAVPAGARLVRGRAEGEAHPGVIIVACAAVDGVTSHHPCPTQATQERENIEREHRAGRSGGHKWPGGPACGSDAIAAPRAPFFTDGDIWRGELLKRQVGRAGRGAQWGAGGWAMVHVARPSVAVLTTAFLCLCSRSRRTRWANKTALNTTD